MADLLTNLFQRYPDPWPLLGLSFITAFLLTGFLFFLAVHRDLLPAIRSRDVHTKRKPRVGGMAMWLAVLVSFIWLVQTRPAGIFSFDRPDYLGLDRALWGILLAMVVILVMGLIDDLKGLHWSGQLAGQLLAALILVAAGITIPYITMPLGGSLVLSPFWSGLFTVVWTMLLINVMNWFDGLDGLAGSIALTAALALFFVSLQVGFVGTATLSLVIVGVTAGFLVWNWYPSKLFMGTIGSQLLGLLLAATAIISGGKVATAALVLGLPVLDAVIVIIRRLLAGQSPFVADQRHLHHRLLKIGLPVPWVVISINVVALTFGVLGIAIPKSSVKGLLLIGVAACMAVFILITYYLERRVGKQ